MEVDPLELAEDDSKGKEGSHLNTYLAASVALLATFMAICEVKGGNIDQEMQRVQVEKNDTWAWYQARNIRQEVLDTSARGLVALAIGQSGAARTGLLDEAESNTKKAESQRSKMEELDKKARELEARYESLNKHDDQLDLEAASLSIAISLLAMTALTRKRWLFAVALLPISLGVVMGVAGLFGLALPASF